MVQPLISIIINGLLHSNTGITNEALSWCLIRRATLITGSLTRLLLLLYNHLWLNLLLHARLVRVRLTKSTCGKLLLQLLLVCISYDCWSFDEDCFLDSMTRRYIANSVRSCMLVVTTLRSRGAWHCHQWRTTISIHTDHSCKHLSVWWVLAMRRLLTVVRRLSCCCVWNSIVLMLLDYLTRGKLEVLLLPVNLLRLWSFTTHWLGSLGCLLNYTIWLYYLLFLCGYENRAWLWWLHEYYLLPLVKFWIFSII